MSVYVLGEPSGHNPGESLKVHNSDQTWAIVPAQFQ